MNKDFRKNHIIFIHFTICSQPGWLISLHFESSSSLSRRRIKTLVQLQLTKTFSFHCDSFLQFLFPSFFSPLFCFRPFVFATFLHLLFSAHVLRNWLVSIVRRNLRFAEVLHQIVSFQSWSQQARRGRCQGESGLWVGRVESGSGLVGRM